MDDSNNEMSDQIYGVRVKLAIWACPLLFLKDRKCSSFICRCALHTWASTIVEWARQTMAFDISDVVHWGEITRQSVSHSHFSYCSSLLCGSLRPDSIIVESGQTHIKNLFGKLDFRIWPITSCTPVPVHSLAGSHNLNIAVPPVPFGVLAVEKGTVERVWLVKVWVVILPL